MNKEETVLKILNEMFPFGNIEATTELIDSNILTSLDLFALVAELEEVFDFRISEELIDVDNFVNVKIIVENVLGAIE